MSMHSQSRTVGRKFRAGALMAALAVVGLVATATGCANYAQFETAEALDDGESRTGAGATFTEAAPLTHLGVGGGEGEQEEMVLVPAAVAWHRQGISDGIEARASAWFPMGFRFGLKGQLVGEYEREGLDVSAGMDTGFLRFGAGSSRGDSEARGTISLIHFYVPLQVGYRAADSVQFYFTPKYVGRLLVGTAEGDADETYRAAELGSIPSVTVGGALGSDVEFHLEMTYGYDRQLRDTILTTGIGMAF